MKHASWGCAATNCNECKLEVMIIQLDNKIKELEYKSTGWYMHVGMRAGFNVLKKELNL